MDVRSRRFANSIKGEHFSIVFFADPGENFGMKRLVCAALLLFSFTVAEAQNGLPGGELATWPEGQAAWNPNLDAWNRTFSGSFEQWFGTPDQSRFRIDLQFDSETVKWGKKITTQSNTATVWWISPMLGGESYTILQALVPWDQNAANQFTLGGGWKYRLFEYVDLDVGGNSTFYTRRTYGPGILATNFGRRYAGDMYLGFIGRTFLNPSLYTIYSMDLGQIIVQGGLFYSFPLGRYVEVNGLSIDFEGKGGYLHANQWLGKDLPFTGMNWGNAYWYGTAKADVVYEFGNGFRANAGVRFSANTDGTGAGFGTLNLGPDKMVWFGAGLSYSF